MKIEYYKVNSYYEGLIQNLYAGSKGCFSSFMQFFYQRNQADVFNQPLVGCFDELCALELENCKILSEIIIKIGGDNKFYSCGKKFLSGASVDYMKGFDKMFLFDIELLEFSVVEVKSLLAKIENVQIKNKLKQVLQNKRLEQNKLKENYFKNGIIE